jgi:hypothetical protein
MRLKPAAIAPRLVAGCLELGNNRGSGQAANISRDGRGRQSKGGMVFCAQRLFSPYSEPVEGQKEKATENPVRLMPYSFPS